MLFYKIKQRETKVSKKLRNNEIMVFYIIIECEDYIKLK